MCIWLDRDRNRNEFPYFSRIISYVAQCLSPLCHSIAITSELKWTPWNKLSNSANISIGKSILFLRLILSHTPKKYICVTMPFMQIIIFFYNCMVNRTMCSHFKSKKKQQSKKCRSKGINTRMCTKNSQLNKLCPFSVIENEMKKTKCLLQLQNEHGNQVPQLNGFVSFSIRFDSFYL